jgi:hypothetical protein
MRCRHSGLGALNKDFKTEKCARRDGNSGEIQESGSEVRCELHKRVSSKRPAVERVGCVRLMRCDGCLVGEKG